MDRVPESGPASIGVAIITWRARDHLDRCLPPLLASRLSPRVLVVNSSSSDGTVERAAQLGAETWVIPRRAFNHGATREAARRRLGTDIAVMMTPDAYPCSERFLETLVAPLTRSEAAVAYARQIADRKADPIARFGRSFNYPPHSSIRGWADRERYGSYIHFCSNACAAWSNQALDDIGGFATTLVSEETITAARLLRAGHKIAYVAEAVVSHTHATRLVDGFRRQFDIGYTRAVFSHLLLEHERDEKRGRAYLRALLRRVAEERPALVGYALLDTALRYLGYRAGMLGPHLPDRLACAMSSQDFYWTSEHRQPTDQRGSPSQTALEA